MHRGNRSPRGPRHRPFSSGDEFRRWVDQNCRAGCIKYSGPDKTPYCELDLALSLAYIRDGQISQDIARRLGCLEPGRLGYPSPVCPERTL